MSKITNDGLTRSSTECFISTHMATVGVKGLIYHPLGCVQIVIIFYLHKPVNTPANGSPNAGH